MLCVPIPSLLAKLMDAKFDPMLKPVPVKEFLPGDRRHPTTSGIEKKRSPTPMCLFNQRSGPAAVKCIYRAPIQGSQCFPHIPTSKDVRRHQVVIHGVGHWNRNYPTYTIQSN
jgi:hypothetical protein